MNHLHAVWFWLQKLNFEFHWQTHEVVDRKVAVYVLKGPWEITHPIPCPKHHQVGITWFSHFVHVSKTERKEIPTLSGNKLQY